MNITLNLSLNDVQTILNVLGELPTKAGVFPLAIEIKTQAEAQIPKQEEPKGE